MKAKYLKYYRRYYPLAPLALLWDSFFEKNKVGKLALANRQQDYVELAQKKELLPLHEKLNQLLLQSMNAWESYDYGSGYFYQGLSSIGIRGLRNTEQRVNEMDLLPKIKGKKILEIGCNTGFLSLILASEAKELTGFDINPHLIKIAESTATHLNITNCRFTIQSFEQYDGNEQYDTVISFANHSTYDGNTKHTIEKFFSKCAKFTAKEGQLLFESHPPDFEGDRLEDVIRTIEKFFVIEHREILEYGTFLDRGRTFITARKK